MIKYDEIYQLQDSLNHSFRWSIKDKKINTGLILRWEEIPKEVVIVKHYMGRSKPKDCIWTSDIYSFIVNERIIKLFQENNITWWKTYDVSIYSKKWELLPGKFFGLIITGRCWARNYSRSTVTLVEYPWGVFPELKWVGFEDDYWDWSDLFMHKESNSGNKMMHKFCTSKVITILEKEKVKNIRYRLIVDSTHSIDYDTPLTQTQKDELISLGYKEVTEQKEPKISDFISYELTPEDKKEIEELQSKKN